MSAQLVKVFDNLLTFWICCAACGHVAVTLYQNSNKLIEICVAADNNHTNNRHILLRGFNISY